MPLHGASSSTRSKAPATNGVARPSPTTGNRWGRPDPVTRTVDHAHPPGVDVEGDDRTGAPHSFGDGGGLPAGCRGEVGDPLARFGRQHHHDCLAALVLRRRPAVADCVETTGIADAAHDHRVVHQAARFDLRARRAQLVSQRARCDPARVGPQRHRSRLVHGRERRHARRWRRAPR